MDDQETLVASENGAGIETVDSMESTIASSWADISKGLAAPSETVARDTEGKFAPKTPAEPAEEPAPPVEAVAEEPIQPAKRAPSSWKREAVAVHEKIESGQPVTPAEMRLLRDEALRREDDFHRGITGYKEAADIGNRMRAVYQPYEATIKSLGVSPDQAVGKLFEVDNTLRHGSPAQKMQLFAQVARDYGIDIGQLQAAPQTPPELLAVQEELRELRASQQRTQQEREQQLAEKEQREVETLNSVVEKFSQGKEHFHVVEREMLALLPHVSAESPTASPEEKLQKAYDMAVHANPKTREAELAKQQQARAAEASKKAQEAKKAASVNVPTRGVIPAGRVLGTMDQTIRENAERLGFGAR